ncbi:MAG: hypothetical protein RXN77_06470 [Sulfolobaceae archaeon]|nr:hypothetical protein [Sulfolobales archaeon]
MPFPLAVLTLTLATNLVNLTIVVHFVGSPPSFGVLPSGYLVISAPANLTLVRSSIPVSQSNSTAIILNPFLISNGNTITLKYLNGSANVTFLTRVSDLRVPFTGTITRDGAPFNLSAVSSNGSLEGEPSGFPTSEKTIYLAIALAAVGSITALELSKRRA